MLRNALALPFYVGAMMLLGIGATFSPACRDNLYKLLDP
jgi:hypothetical protein